MDSHLLAVAVTIVDLLALFTCVGALAARVWIVPTSEEYPAADELSVMRSHLSRVLAAGLVVLAASSAAQLLVRAAGMSGLPLPDLWPVLPAVLLQTHYGHVWLLRPLALAALTAGWLLARRRPESRALLVAMTAVCGLLIVSRCAAGHGADAGDLALPELMDCVHLLAGALWGGSLIAVSVAVLPPALERCEERPALLADLSGRFSTLSGIALAGVLVAGAYNAVLEVGSWRALRIASYGNTLAVKLVLVVAMIALGASNRYFSIPPLREWAGFPNGGRGTVLRLLAPILARQRRRPGRWVASRFRGKILAEVLLLLGVLACTALLVQGVPARHAVMAMGPGSMHGMSHDLPPLTPQEVASRYRVRVETDPARPVAGRETRVNVFVADASGRPVTTLEMHHERLIHFLVVSENLEEFHHLHPEDFGLLTEEAKRQGRFTFPVTFGSGGRYGLAADFMDQDREGHWSTTLAVDGPAQGPTVWQLSRQRKADGLEARLTTAPDPPLERETTEGTIDLTSGGRPVTDLDLWLGALCHLAIFGERLSSSAHEHGGDAAMARGGMHMPRADYRGPRIYFGYEFPAGGRYRIFSQFERAGRVYTVPFDLEVGSGSAPIR